MNTVQIHTLPQIRFAHAFHPQEYHGKLPIRQDFMEVTYVSEGSLTFRIGSETLIAHQGDILCNLYKNEIFIDTDSYHCHHTVGASVSFSLPQHSEGHLCLPFHTKASANTAILIQMIDQLVCNPSSYMGAPEKGAGWFLRILSELDNCSRSTNPPQLYGEQFYVSKAKDYILQNLKQPITQREVAAYLDLTPGYLCSVFKKVEHTTLMQYINRKKLEGIRLLMQQKNLKLHEAATLFGYNDANYVSRLHKKIYQYNITDKPSLPKGRETINQRMEPL